MKKEVLYVAVFGVLCALAGVLLGVSIARKPHLPWAGRHGAFSERAERFFGYRQSPGGPLDMLSMRLNLDGNQKEKIKAILEETRNEIEKLGEKIRTSIGEIRQKGDRKIMGILNPEQQKEFRSMLEGFKSMRGQKMRPPIDENMPPREALPDR